jgi:hypothetical protein
MTESQTQFASIDDYVKGGVKITGHEDPRHYAFSNLFEVARHARAYERVVVARNLEYVIEAVRAEGDSSWYLCSHDETALVMQGALTVRFVRPDAPAMVPPVTAPGAVKLGAPPAGRPMGYVRARRGHQILLPAGAAYRFQPSELSVILIQTMLGPESIERWSEICQLN